MLDCLQGHWNIRKRFEPEAGQGLPFLLEMLVDDGILTLVADGETLIVMNEDEEEFCVDVQFRYPTTAAGGLKTVGLDLRLHYIEFKSARYVLCIQSHNEDWWDGILIKRRTNHEQLYILYTA